MAGRPRPGSNELKSALMFEEIASGPPIHHEPFTYDPVRVDAEHERNFPEGYRAFVEKTTPGKVGPTIGDLLRSAHAAKNQESEA